MAIVNTGGNDVQLKTINNESLKGTGNISIDGLPDSTSANAGDVLTLDSNKDAVWQAPSGGLTRTITDITSYNELVYAMTHASLGDMIVGAFLGRSSSTDYAQEIFAVATRDLTGAGSMLFITKCKYFKTLAATYRDGMLEMYYTSNSNYIRIDYATSDTSDNYVTITSTDNIYLDSVKWIHFT